MELKKQLIIPPIKLSGYHKFVIACLNSPGADKNVLFQIHKKNQAHIIFNRPQKMNALTIDIYYNLAEYIRAANQMQEIKFIIIQGNGGNFSSGNDLSSPNIKGFDSLNQLSEAKAFCIKRLTSIIINSEKPIFALVEGKCIGITFSMLPLFDKVYATQNAFFSGPFVRLGVCPQTSSSYTFSQALGSKLAEEVLIKGTQITSKTLQKHNFLTCTQNINKATNLLQNHIDELSQLDWTSYKQARKLMRKRLTTQSMKAIDEELQVLKISWANPQMPKIITNYIKRQKSLKNQPRPKL